MAWHCLLGATKPEGRSGLCLTHRCWVARAIAVALVAVWGSLSEPLPFVRPAAQGQEWTCPWSFCSCGPPTPRRAESLQTFNLRTFIIRGDYFLFLP